MSPRTRAPKPLLLVAAALATGALLGPSLSPPAQAAGAGAGNEGKEYDRTYVAYTSNEAGNICYRWRRLADGWEVEQAVVGGGVLQVETWRWERPKAPEGEQRRRVR